MVFVQHHLRPSVVCVVVVVAPAAELMEAAVVQMLVNSADMVVETGVAIVEDPVVYVVLVLQIVYWSYKRPQSVDMGLLKLMREYRT